MSACEDDYGPILRLRQQVFALDARFFLCQDSAMKNARHHVKLWLHANRMRQYELAEEVGITPEQMSRVLKRMTPGLMLRKLIAAKTGLPVEDVSAWEIPE